MTEMTTAARHPLVPMMTPEEYTRTDEELLREGQWAARTAILTSSALSVGVSQRDEARCIVRARQLGIPVIRRSTGGLGLWHAPGDVVWSLVLPRSDPRVGDDFSKAYARLGAGVVHCLASRSVAAVWQAPSGPPGEYCLLSGAGAILSVDGRALGGAAQHLTRHALLHHGVLPYRLDPRRLSELFDLSPELIDRSLTSLDRVTPGTTALELAGQLQSDLVASAKETES